MLLSLLSRLGHQRSQFPPINGTGGTLCPFCLYFNSSGSCILNGRPLCLEWASIGTAIAPPGFTLMHSTLALKLLFLAVLELGAFLSSNLEEALYKFM